MAEPDPRISDHRRHLAAIGHDVDGVDLNHLTTEALVEYLRRHGGHNPWAENLLLGLLGHEQVAHLYPVWVEQAAARIDTGEGAPLLIAADDDGVVLAVEGVNRTLPVDRPRLYNAALLLIQAAKQEEAERD